jgi:MurNAc alpha-1-phosphate uridylyltransferase
MTAAFPVAILAGGLATRLRPITQSTPKSLVDVAGRPFLLWQLDYLRAQGLTDIVLCVGYLGEQIRDLIGDGSAFGVQVRYSFDGPTLLGTGGALCRALPYLGDTFFVYYGDSFLPIDFVDVAEKFLALKKPALMTVLKNQNQWDTSNVLFEEGTLLEYNKQTPHSDMTYIDYGLGIVTADALKEYPLDEAFDLGEVYHRLSLRGQLAGYEVFERFYEIGSPLGLQETIDYLIGRKIS